MMSGNIATAITRIGRTLIATVPGAFETGGMELLKQQLLSKAYEEDVRAVVIEMSSVPYLDRSEFNHLTATARALRLLGVCVVVSGLSAPIAAYLADVDIDQKAFLTTLGLDEALALAGKVEG